MITNYTEFKDKLLEIGFSSGGSEDDGVISISKLYAPNIKWHTGDPNTDPWEWRIRILEESKGIAYSKLFFKKSGYIASHWYPYFLAVRQPLSFDECYDAGLISCDAKKIYDIIKSNGATPLHILKAMCNVIKETKSKFERALVDLQMKMYITICGRMQKISADGKPYGWYSTVFCLSEHYFDTQIITSALNRDEAFEKIKKQIYKTNPDADEKRVVKFITG